MRCYPQRIAQSGLRRSHEGGKGSAALKSWTQLNLCKSFGTQVSRETDVAILVTGRVHSLAVSIPIGFGCQDLLVGR